MLPERKIFSMRPFNASEVSPLLISDSLKLNRKLV